MAMAEGGFNAEETQDTERPDRTIDIFSGVAMTVIRPVLALVALTVMAAIDVIPAAAQTATCRPWCVHYSADGTNCGFVSREQCNLTARRNDVACPTGLARRGMTTMAVNGGDDSAPPSSPLCGL
jgi:hypothetical protein